MDKSINARDIFSAKNVTRMAVFTALSTVLYLFVKFPLPIFPAWLDIQISELPALLAGYMMGPWYGAAVIVLKCLIKMPMTSTACVGELGDIMMGLAFVLPAAFIYKYRRTLKGALVSLGVGVLASTAMAMLLNWLVLVPLYLKLYFGGSWNAILGMLSGLYPDITKETFYLYYEFCGVLPFNILRGIICAVATFLLYKHLERLFNYIFAKDRKRVRLVEYAGGAGEASGGADTDTAATAAGGCSSDNPAVVATPEEMEELGRSIGAGLAGGEVILLSGELGAGKTVFCKGLAKGLGFDGEVVSPTFTLMNEYRGGRLDMWHIDAYRLSSADEGYAAGLADRIGAADGVCAVEWWENIDGLFDGCTVIKVCITKCGDGREVTVTR